MPEQQPSPKIITANRLIDGAVVYMTDSGWSENIAEALISASEEQQSAMLMRAENEVANQVVVEAYLIPVTGEGSALTPLTLREQIRAKGPTIRLEDNQNPRPNPSANRS